jgi:hypothetical protein
MALPVEERPRSSESFQLPPLDESRPYQRPTRKSGNGLFIVAVLAVVALLASSALLLWKR